LADDVRAHIDDRDYFERVISDLATRLDQRFAAQEQAQHVALIELNRRLDHLNDAFNRADQVARQTLSLDVYKSEHSAVVRRLERIETQQARLIGALIFATLVMPLAVAGATHLLST
jgi:hypothetical protein